MTDRHLIFTMLRLITMVAISATTGCTNAYRQDQQMKRADRYFEQKKYQEASIEYANVLRKETTNLVALCQLGLCSLELENRPQAFSLLLRAQKLAPENPSVQAILARLYLADGSPDKARELALAIFKKGSRPLEMMDLIVETSLTRTQAVDALQLVTTLKDQFLTNSEYQATSGLLSLKLGDFKSAEDHFQTAVTLDPGYAKGYLGLAMLHQAKGENEAAEHNFKKAASLAGVQSAENTKWALFEMDIGKPEEARQIFTTIASQNARNVFPLIQLTKIAMNQKRFQEAEKTCDMILRQFPNHVEAHLLHAHAKMACGKTAEGLNELQQLVSTYPRAGPLHYELALALLKTTTPDKAIPELKAALELNPAHTDATLLLADLFIRTGDGAAAIRILTELTDIFPSLSRAYLLLGAAHQSLGQLDRALNTYAKLGQLNPKSPQPYYLAGLIYLKQNNHKSAVRSFTQAADLAPGFVLPLAQLVTLDLHDQQIEHALTRINQAIQHAPESGALSYLQGQVYSRMGNPNKAEASFQRAIDLEPEALSPYVALSKLYLSTQRGEEALRRLSEALQQNPYDPACLMLTALILSQGNDIQKAADTYERLIEVKPDFIPALNNLACLYAAKLDQLNKAYTLATRARAVAPRDPYVADTLGWILYRKGDARWAASLLQESAEALPAEGEVLYHLAMAQLMLGREAASLDGLRGSLKAEKGFPQKDRAVRLLALLELPAQGLNEPTTRLLDEILKEDPDNPSALIRKAALYTSKGDIDSAVLIYEQVRKSCPTFYPASARLAALLQENSTSLDKAFELASQARECAPHDPEVAHLLGWLAFQKNQYKWALSLLLEASEADPANPQLLYHLAMVKYRLGQEENAITLIQKALNTKSPFAETPAAAEFLELTDSAKYARAPQAALYKAESTLQKEPTNLPALMLAARAHRALGNQKEARRCYEKLISNHADFAPALLAISSLYAESPAELENALAAAQKARALMPDSIQAAKALGHLSLTKGNYEYAAALMQEVVIKSPRDEEALLDLGVTRMKLKEIDAARKALKQVIESAPASPSARSAQHWLNELKR